MLESMFRSTSLPAIEHTLAFTEKRHGLLAGNIANLDTPGYQTRDLSVEDFHSALAETFKKPEEPHPQQAYLNRVHSSQSSPRGLLSQSRLVPDHGTELYAGDLTSARDPIAEATDPQEKVRDTMKQILYHDASDVSLEEQVTEISKNASLHNAAIAMMRNQMRALQIAVSESVNI